MTAARHFQQRWQGEGASRRCRSHRVPRRQPVVVVVAVPSGPLPLHPPRASCRGLTVVATLMPSPGLAARSGWTSSLLGPTCGSALMPRAGGACLSITECNCVHPPSPSDPAPYLPPLAGRSSSRSALFSLKDPSQLLLPLPLLYLQLPLWPCPLPRLPLQAGALQDSILPQGLLLSRGDGVVQ